MDDERKQNFMAWLQGKRVKNMTPSTCVECMEVASAYALKHKVSRFAFWAIDDYKDFNVIRNKLSGDRLFRLFNGRKAKGFELIVGKLYSDFLREEVTPAAPKAGVALDERPQAASPATERSDAGFSIGEVLTEAQKSRLTEAASEPAQEAEPEQAEAQEESAEITADTQAEKEETSAVSQEEREAIAAFFQEKESAELFERLFAYLRSACDGIVLDVRDRYIIGAKREGEKCRFYVHNSSLVIHFSCYLVEGLPYQKRFTASLWEEYLVAVRETNRYFAENPYKVALKTEWHKIKRDEPNTPVVAAIEEQDEQEAPVSTVIDEEKTEQEAGEEAAPSAKRAHQPLWDKYEAAVLLDGYLKTTRGANRQDIVAAVSATLRQMAIRQGKTIDDAYRNISGISYQIYRMQFAYTGDSSHTSTAKFDEVVALYKNKRSQFYDLLQEAYQRCVTPPSVQEARAQEPPAPSAIQAPTESPASVPAPTETEGEEGKREDILQEQAQTEEGDNGGVLTVDFAAPADYTFTRIQSVSYFDERSESIKTWRDCYQFILQKLAEDYPHRIEEMLQANVVSGGRVELSRKPDVLRAAMPVADGLYAESNHSAVDIVRKIAYFLDFCHVDYENVTITYAKKDRTKAPSPSFVPVGREREETDEQEERGEMLAAVQDLPDNAELIEQRVLEADMDGVTLQELADEFRMTMVSTRATVQSLSRVVSLKDKLYHEEAFLDWQEGADALFDIMQKLMQRNNGYVSSAQLYDYARERMYLFLNDNGIADEGAVYELAQHLFEKNSYKGAKYSFAGKTHISEGRKIESVYDLACKFAAERGGVFTEDELTEYVTRAGGKATNLRQRLRLDEEPTFLYRDESEILYAPFLHVDEAWFSRVADALNKLFDDLGDHVVLSQINPFWFQKLPALPQGKPWTPFLLQGVLRFYGRRLKARTIAALSSQDRFTLHAMLVSADSPVQNFRDAVISYFYDNQIERTDYDAGSLRQVLLAAGMIHGGELSGNGLYKALSGDARFVWNAAGDRVTVRLA